MSSLGSTVLTSAGHTGRGELAVLQNIITEFAGKSEEKTESIHSLLYSDLGAQLPLHISLSRPVVLQTDQRSSFVETFRTALYDSHIQP